VHSVSETTALIMRSPHNKSLRIWRLVRRVGPSWMIEQLIDVANSRALRAFVSAEGWLCKPCDNVVTNHR
jgi:hypothetical protein